MSCKKETQEKWDFMVRELQGDYLVSNKNGVGQFEPSIYIKQLMIISVFNS